jgi:hypothetical protein
VVNANVLRVRRRKMVLAGVHVRVVVFRRRSLVVLKDRGGGKSMGRWRSLLMYPRELWPGRILKVFG